MNEKESEKNSGKEYVEYAHWKTGRKFTRELSNSHPAQHKTSLICPFDNTPLIRWHNEMDKGYECLNCGIDYKISSGTQENVDKYAEKYFQKVQDKIDELDERKNNLEVMLNHAINQGIAQERDLFSRFRGTSIFPDKEKENLDYYTPDMEKLAKIAQEINQNSTRNNPKNNK